MSVVVRSRNVEETRTIAGALAPVLRPRDLIVLAGELGSGKTAFTQGLAAALGVREPVTSPTFTLARTYEGIRPLHHLDVYRLERLSELYDLGLAELLDGDGIVVIEWGDAVTGALPADYLEVAIGFGETDDLRTITATPVGRAWAGRERAVGEALGAWRC